MALQHPVATYSYFTASLITVVIQANASRVAHMPSRIVGRWSEVGTGHGGGRSEGESQIGREGGR